LITRFSPAAKRVLRAAEQECRNHNHYYVGVEHLLLALLDEHDPAVDARLAEIGVRADEARVTLRASLGTGEERLWDGILVTPRVRSVVRLAEAAAGGGLVEPLGLLEAIREEGGGFAADFLRTTSGAG